MVSANECPLETRLVTVFKVDSFEVEHHTTFEPYYQIWVSGFILDGFKDKVNACINLSSGDGDISKVREYESIYSIGSIHKLDTSLFGAKSSYFHFYGPDTEKVPQDKYEEFNSFFIPSERWEPAPEFIDFNNISLSSIASLIEKEDGSFVRILCKVKDVREVGTSIGSVMGFITVMDLSGESKVTLFSDIYPEVSSMIRSDDSLIIGGKLELSDQGPTIILTSALGLISNTR